MESYGWLSILPPIVAIGLAIRTKQVYLSLALFVLLGWTIMHGWNPLAGLIASVDSYIAAVTDPDNARVLMFSVLIGCTWLFVARSRTRASMNSARYSHHISLLKSSSTRVQRHGHRQ